MPSVLIIDDEPNIRRMVGALLGAEGYEVRDAADGATATSAQSFTVSISAGSAVAALTTPAIVHSGAAIAGTLTTSISAPTRTFSTTRGSRSTRHSISARWKAVLSKAWAG